MAMSAYKEKLYSWSPKYRIHKTRNRDPKKHPMPSFSKPVQGENTQLPAKWKRTLTPKIIDQDNVDADAVKRRKQAQPTNIEDEDEDHTHYNVGQPRNADAILERADGSDDPDDPNVTDKESEREEEGSALQEETDEQELGDSDVFLAPWHY
jgi:hypothetical protein